MIRCCLVLVLVLVLVLNDATTATPLKPWEKLANEVVLKGEASFSDKAMASWVEQVEPPDDTDATAFDIDPDMKIWKKVQPRVHFEPEADLDEVREREVLQYLAPLLMGYKDEVYADPEAETEMRGRRHLEPEPDMDDIHHPIDPELGPYREARPVPPAAAAVEGPHVRRHTQPEQDLDDRYHQ